MIYRINNMIISVNIMAAAINYGIDFSSNMQSLDDDYLSTLAKLPKNYSEEDKFTLINLVEKFKVAMSYLHVNDHTKFWNVLKTILENEIIFRELVLIIHSDPNEYMKYEDFELNSIIWRFGVYNNFRLLLLQELSNVITNLYEKAKLFLHVNSSVAKKVVHQADRVSKFYVTQFKSIKVSDIIKEDNLIENCVEIVNSTIQMGKDSLKI
ncbi:MAG: hypothetical protein HeimC3_08900 [Candidatus Heimdallarchaeota archaeon LC_3]|nr:MAG: hypothetical protein HeimC3_08900 [Candidatus Heimdallarchaeota archaeon LC_3]